MAHLRDLGIYKLPNVEHRLYSIRGSDGKYLLYDDEIRGLPPQFALQPDGLITPWFDGSPLWTVNDLIDTGETKQMKT